MGDQEDGTSFSFCNLLTNDNCIDLRLGPGVSRARPSDEARVSNTTKTCITSMQFSSTLECWNSKRFVVLHICSWVMGLEREFATFDWD